MLCHSFSPFVEITVGVAVSVCHSWVWLLEGCPEAGVHTAVKEYELKLCAMGFTKIPSLLITYTSWVANKTICLDFGPALISNVFFNVFFFHQDKPMPFFRKLFFFSFSIMKKAQTLASLILKLYCLSVAFYCAAVCDFYICLLFFLIVI